MTGAWCYSPSRPKRQHFFKDLVSNRGTISVTSLCGKRLDDRRRMQIGMAADPSWAPTAQCATCSEALARTR